jgi:hypothetical protein
VQAIESTTQSKLDSLHALLAKQHRTQMLQGALAILNACKSETEGSFVYYGPSLGSSHSWKLVSNIIANSLRGYGYKLKGYRADAYGGDREQAFRDALSHQVEGLLGVKPTFFKDNDGDVCIKIPSP